jgi:hypothetical protein
MNSHPEFKVYVKKLRSEHKGYVLFHFGTEVYVEWKKFRNIIIVCRSGFIRITSEVRTGYLSSIVEESALLLPIILS